MGRTREPLNSNYGARGLAIPEGRVMVVAESATTGNDSLPLTFSILLIIGGLITLSKIAVIANWVVLWLVRRDVAGPNWYGPLQGAIAVGAQLS